MPVYVCTCTASLLVQKALSTVFLQPEVGNKSRLLLLRAGLVGVAGWGLSSRTAPCRCSVLVQEALGGHGDA